MERQRRCKTGEGTQSGFHYCSRAGESRRSGAVGLSTLRRACAEGWMEEGPRLFEGNDGFGLNFFSDNWIAKAVL